MSLIQRFPAALLPLLSIKASDTPPNLADTVTPGLDLMPSYVADRVEVVSGQVLGTTIVVNATITVPAGEWWYLYGVSAIANNATVGSSVQLHVGIADQAQTSMYLNAMTAATVSVAGQSIICAAQIGIPLLLKPGMVLFAGTGQDPGAGTLDLYCRALIARLAAN